MRSLLAIFQLSLIFSSPTSAHPPNLASFILAIDGQEEPLYINNDTSIPPQPDISEKASDPFNLFKRQNCSPDFYYCSTIPSTAVCCPTTALCTTDASNNAACCPIGSFCTGTIPVVIPSIGSSPALTTVTNPAGASSAPVTAIVTTTDADAGGGLVTLTLTSTTLIPITTISTTAFGTPGSTAAAAPPPNTLPASYVPNAYSFPFAYLPSTSFSNSADCASAYSSCAAEYAVCTSDLQGGGVFGVTIVGPSTTVVGGGSGTSLAPQAAVAVCESLSNIACPGVAGGCAVFGTAGSGPTTGAVGTAVPSGAGRRNMGARERGFVVGVLVMSIVRWLL